MSPASHRPYLVQAIDYGVWDIVVEAASKEEAIKKAEALYTTDGFGNTDAFRLLHGDVAWTAKEVVPEVQR